MNNPLNSLLFHLATDATVGNGDPAELHKLTQHVNDKAPKGGRLPVKDATGDFLTTEDIYLLRCGRYDESQQRVKFTRVQYGQGNIMDTYYRLFYIDETLEERMIVVEGRGSIFSGFEYQSFLIEKNIQPTP